MKSVLEIYAQMLSERLETERRTKEDEARYTFFCALIQSGHYRHIDVSLETPHPSLHGKEIDTILEPVGPYPARALEFKFDQMPHRGSQNKTNRAGSVFNDLTRLAQAKFARPTEAYFVYVTDRSMQVYFNNKSNTLRSFYAPDVPDIEFQVNSDFWNSRPKSFLSHVKAPMTTFSTRLYYSAELPKGFVLRVFKVIPI